MLDHVCTRSCFRAVSVAPVIAIKECLFLHATHIQGPAALMASPRRPVQVAFLALALLLVILYLSAAFQPQYPGPAVSRPLRTSFSKDTTGNGVLDRLERTLQKLEGTPITTYEEALRKNEQTCKDRQVQSNPDQVAGEGSFWCEVSSETLEEKRQNIITAIKEQFGLPGLHYAVAKDLVMSPMYGDGRGLVFTGGNKVSRSANGGIARSYADRMSLRARRIPCRG